MPTLGIGHIGEQERAPLAFRHAAQELPPHQRMQFGVFVDRAIDAYQETVGFEVGEVLLEIEPRPADFGPQGGVQDRGLVEHAEAPKSRAAT